MQLLTRKEKESMKLKIGQIRLSILNKKRRKTGPKSPVGYHQEGLHTDRESTKKKRGGKGQRDYLKK